MRSGEVSDGLRTSVSHERIYQDHVPLIDEVLTLICRQKHLSGADAADFRQEAHLKLLEKGTLLKHDGRGSMRSFLLIVLLRAYKDFRIRSWGKWRPSVTAQRHGDVAVLLERLIARDGLSFEEAYETLRTNHGVTAPRAELEQLAPRLPPRVSRKTQTEEVLVTVPSPAPRPDTILSREEAQSRAAHVREQLVETLRDLDPADRLIVKLRYIDGLKVVQIASLLRIDAKPLYRRIEQLLRTLRRGLAARGVDGSGLFDAEST